MPPKNSLITIFTSIPGIAESLLKVNSNLPLRVLEDSRALYGYGGTVHFDPSKLQDVTIQSLKEAEILISEPAIIAKLLEYDQSALSSLQWCQSTYAGVDPIFNSTAFSYNLKTERPSWKLTRFAGCFGPPIAEWCLARIIGQERNFAASNQDQKDKIWAGSKDKILNYRYLSSLTLSILGCGDIGTCIAKEATLGFGMKTIGYGKTPRLEKQQHQDDAAFDMYTTDLKLALQEADYIVSVLPSTPETRGLLNDDTFKVASRTNGGKSPVFLNVGRGDVISEETIINGLNQQWISGAILDVFETEPLPTTSRLWDRDDVIVSPHVSGLTQASDVPKVFLSNYELYLADKPLQFLVDWEKGY